jgi:cyclase
MQRLVVLGTVVLVGALSAVVAGFQQPAGRAGGGPAPMVIEVEKIRPNLYILKGGGGNTAALVTDTGVTLVDTKLPGWGKPLIDKVKELTDKPVTTIINTHTHFDHVSGNVEFPATVEVITHENTARLMREANPVLGIQTGPQPNLFTQNNGVGLAKRTFKDTMTLGTGQNRIELHYFGRAHTSGDAFVVFPSLRVLHTGDAFPNKGIPIMDANNGGSGVSYADTIDKVARLPNIDTVITGHAATTMTIADVKDYADFNRAFVDDVRAAKKAGRTVDEVATSWKVPERFKGYAQPPPERLKVNAQVVWNEIK